MDARKSPARGLRCLVTWSAAVLGMWEAGWGFPHVSGLDTIVAGLSWHQVTSPSPLSKGLHSKGRHLSRHLGQPCGCWGVPCAIPSARGAPWGPVPRAGSTAGSQLAQPVCSPPDQRRLQPVSFSGSLGACPSGSSSLCCQEFGAASGSGRPAAPVPARLGPSKEASSRSLWSPLQNLLPSHPHPPPLTSGSFRMQLNTSALKISGANCLVMKTLITGQLKP